MAAVSPTLTSERTHRQCPRCGRATVVAHDHATHWGCSWCGHDFTVTDGEPWPDVVLCLWLPARPARPAPDATDPSGDRT